MSDDPQVRIEVAEGDRTECCDTCNFFALARSRAEYQLFVMGWCTLNRVEVLPEAVCKRYQAVK